jgi:hypothetical protein
MGFTFVLGKDERKRMAARITRNTAACFGVPGAINRGIQKESGIFRGSRSIKCKCGQARFFVLLLPFHVFYCEINPNESRAMGSLAKFFPGRARVSPNL